VNIKQCEITLSAKPRGFHLVTDEVLEQIPFISEAKIGQLTIFIKHSSASIAINEYADPRVRTDMESFFTDICDNKPYYTHTDEGPDDMPSHIKASIIGSTITIPVTDGRPSLGIWQGIYLNEHRSHGGNRNLVATLIFN